jgi:transposase InsO family protein
VSRYRFVSENHHDHGVKRPCEVLGISRSGYYAWRVRGPSPHAQRDAELSAVVAEVHSRSRRTYGAPRVHAELGRIGHRTAKKRVARLMRGQGLIGAHSRRKWRTGKPDTAWAPDLLERNFNPTGRDRVWAADVTQFRTEEGWLHFAGVIDLYSRRVIGWAMGNTPDADLVIDAMVMAFERRRPDQRVIHHADRGAAYTSMAFGQQLDRLGIAASFGSTGDAYDNAAVESTWSVLKRELAWIHGQHTWRTRDLLRSAIFDYVEGFYNTQRIKARLGYRSPAEFEQQAIA